jgi:histidine triad (HIT) family protein
MMNCLFCQIISEKKSPWLYEDEKAIVFADIAPQASTHLLIVPKQHIPTINDVTEKDENLLGHLITIAKKMAYQFKIEEAGYRLVFNCNHDGGQAIYHIHLHLLGGRPMTWPPG